MAEKPVLLTRRDLDKIQESIDAVRRQVQNPQMRPAPLSNDPAPETLIVKTATAVGTGSGNDDYGVLPARVGTVLGSVDCEVFQNLPAGLESTGRFLTVYNLSENDVPAGTYLLASRDKFGTWIATEVIGAEVVQELVTEICRPDAAILALTSHSINGTNSPNLINWATAEYDVPGLWNGYSKVRVRRSGLYWVHAGAAFSILGDATWLGIRIRRNGIAWFGNRFPVNNTTSWGLETQRLYYCEEGDILEVDVTHNSVTPTSLTMVDGLFDVHEVGSPYITKIGTFPTGTSFSAEDCVMPSAACCETGEVGVGTGSGSTIGTGTGTGTAVGVAVSVSTGCCATTPQTMTAVLTNSIGCACLDGLSVTLTNTSGSVWSGSAASGCAGGAVHVRLECKDIGAGFQWHANVKCGSAPASSSIPRSSETCIPFSATWTAPVLIPDSSCCTGSIGMTVT